jgi:HEAT repeat protein
MARKVRIWLLTVCGCIIVALPSPAADGTEDEQTLLSAGLATDGRSLLDFFRKQTATEDTRRQAGDLIRLLGADSFQVREKASTDLVTLGPVVLPLLRQEVRNASDLEVRRRARACAEQIQTDYTPAVASAAARLVALRKPSGAAESLLAFLPSPYDESVDDEIQEALVAVGRIEGELNPALVAGLNSDTPARRSASAVALCRLGDTRHRRAVRKLLADGEPTVRLQVGQALAIAGDREAVPVLIDVLSQVPSDQAGQVEDLLYRLAGADATSFPPGSESTDRLKYSDAWRNWWSKNGERVDMAVLRDTERTLGYTLLILLNAHRVVEWDRDGKPRWQIDGLASPLDAEVVSGRRVLIAEHDTKRVTERNFKGEVLWEKKLSDSPIHAQRLPGGATFVATRRLLLEVDRSGKEVVRYHSPHTIITARRFRDGRIGCIEKGSYLELDASGKETKRFAVGVGVYTTNALTLLPHGHLLITSYGGGTVQEYDPSGKVVWQVSTSRPLCALRLPGGNTLVSSQDMVLVELDRAGKEVSRREAQGHPCQIRRR